MKISINVEFECSREELEVLTYSDFESTIVEMIGEQIVAEKMKKAAPKKAVVKRQAPKKVVKRQATKRNTSK